MLGIILALTGREPVLAAWPTTATGPAKARAVTAPTGNVKPLSVTGRNVKVEWNGSTLPDGTPATGYEVRRYTASNDPATAPAGCSGTVNGLTCTESAVSPGTWNYTVTPKYQGWTGSESAHAANVVVGAPTLTIDPPTSVGQSALPATFTGTISNFIDAQSMRFRIGDPANGTPLNATVAGNATPAPVPAGGSASVSFTVPSGTAAGTHSIYAVTEQNGESASGVITVTASGLQPPTVVSAVIASHPTRGRGQIKQGGTYHVYAQLSGTVDSASTNVASITANASSVALTPCTQGCTLRSVTYNYKSTLQTARSPLAGGPYTYTVTATNSAGSDTETFSVNVDNLPPTPTGFVLQNGPSPNAIGKPEQNDKIIITFSEGIAVNTFCSNWDDNEAAQTATNNVTITNGSQGNHDVISFANTASCGSFALGTIGMGAQGFVEKAPITYVNSPVNWNPTTNQLTVTLGAPCTTGCGTLKPSGGPVTTATFTPAATLQDAAGNSITGTIQTNNGSNSEQF